MKKLFFLLTLITFTACEALKQYKDTLVVTFQDNSKDTIINTYEATEQVRYALTVYNGSWELDAGTATLAKDVTRFSIIKSTRTDIVIKLL